MIADPGERGGEAAGPAGEGAAGTPRPWREMKEILGAVLELPPEDRPGFLEDACLGPETRREVERFLEAYEEDSAFLEVPAVAEGPPAPEELAAGTRLGPYRLRRKLGAGGMGEVYLADQEGPIRRQVALKIVRGDGRGRQLAARFAVERQALALMTHPNIARVFDAGESASGRPYFAMEAIDGPPITVFCDSRRSSLERRVELMIEVCRGVQHAHQKGILHRDLKPSNVLVTLEDGRAVPKIIDFGVAKTLVGEGAESTFHTLQGQGVGTPEYMSPEQAAGGEIDTRTDVYSLGVLLYELLVGAKPLDAAVLQRAGLAVWLHTLQEEDPPAPSRRLRSLGAEAEDRARDRGLDGTALERRLRGDLDAIVLKAMSRDPELRYPSAGDLAADLRRHLSFEPVQAAPPRLGYQLRRMIRRHRLAFAAAATVLVALLVAVSGTSLGLVRARKAEDRALSEADRANREAVTAREINQFLVEIFQTSEPRRALRPDMTLREVLDLSTDRVRGELRAQPQVQARLLQVMGRSYLRLGLPEQARELLEETLRIQRREGSGELELAETLYKLSAAHRDLGEYGEGRQLLEEVVALREKQLGGEHPEVGRTLIDLGIAHMNLGDHERAREIYERSLGILEKGSAADPTQVARGLTNLGLLLIHRQEFPEAEEHLERALSLQRGAVGEDHPNLSYSLHNLSLAAVLQGEADRARDLLEQAIEIDERVFGSDHPNITFGLYNLATLHRDQGECPSAEALYRRTLLILESHLGPSHPKVMDVSQQLEDLPTACPSS